LAASIQVCFGTWWCSVTMCRPSGLHRIGAEGDAGCGLSAYHYFYGDPVDTEASTAVWQKWLTNLFPAPVPASTSV
jgi:hypothetical protein